VTLREWLDRLRGTLQPRRRDAELQDELRLHLELAAERAERSGLAPADARRAAALRSGGVDQAMEALRDQRGLPWLDSLRRDALYAWRAFASRPGFAAIAILTQGSALGLCLTVVTFVNAYLVRSMPYPSAERIHRLSLRTPEGARLAGLERVDWSALDDLVEHRIAWHSDAFALLGGTFPETARGGWVSPGFVAGLGLRPELGRLLDERDHVAGGATPVLISHALWMRRFGGDPGVVGRSVRAVVRDRPDEAETLTIVGVVAEFWHINPHRDVFAPLRGPAPPNMLRLRPGVDAGAVADRVTTLVREGARGVPDGWQARLTSLQDGYVEGVRPILKAVLFSAGLVLLIACANVAVLLLVRSTRRRHEMAIRLALGASRVRLVRLLGLEALLLGGLATVFGGALSVALVRAAAPFVEDHVERPLPGGAAAALTLDPLLVAAMLAGGVVLTAVLTLVPLVALRATSVTGALKSAGRGATEGRTARRLRSTLIGAEVAAALALLAASALLIRTSVTMLGVDPGFRAEGLVTADVALRTRAYPDATRRARFYERVLERLDGRGGASRSALSSGWPLYRAEARPVERVGPAPESVRPGVTQVTAGYFAALGMPVLDGTSFEAHDRPGGDPVAVVSESLARRLWPHGRAVGQELRIGEAGAEADAVPAGATWRVVGVVRDVARVDYHDGRVRAPADRLDVYLPLLQAPGPAVHLFAPDDASAPDAIRAAVAELDPEVAVEPPRSVAELLEESRRGPRQLAWVLSSFAAFAALIALVGVYSVCAYSVRQREREIGVRLVVGADPSTVTRLFVREGGLSIGAGLAAGLLAAAALGHVLRSQLFGVEPLAPGVLAATTALFAACGVLALWWPASRAARIDPARVLKDE
jgi:predicted permease